jgi:hypothetical protein
MQKFRQGFLYIFTIILIFIYHSSFAALTTPSITSPSNNSTNIANKVTITSNNVSGAINFLFEIDSIATFKSAYRKKIKVSVNNIVLDSLPFNKNHFVRVKVFNASSSDSSAWSTTNTFKTFSNFTSFGASSGYALLQFGWNANSIVKAEINIDTSNLFNSPCFASYISTSPSTSNCTFKYTQSQKKYFYRYRAKYGSQSTNWNYGTAISNKGYEVAMYSVSDSMIFFKTILLAYNYSGDTSVKMKIFIDTTTNFNSSNLFTKTITLDKFDFNAKPGKKYFMRIEMLYPKGGWNGDSIYKFNTAKNTKPYSYEFGQIRFFIPKGFTNAIIELDTTPNFNSNLKQTLDTSLPILNYEQSIYKNYNNIRLYSKMFLRYKVKNSEFSLNWYSTYTRFLKPSSSLAKINNHPITPYSNTTFNDQTGLVYEVDTTLNFNSKYKIRHYISIVKNDSVKSLKFGKSYYIRFKNFNANKDTTQWGLPFQFKTIDTVRVISPSSPTIDSYKTYNLYAENLSGVKIYHWQLDTNVNFSTPVNIYSSTYSVSKRPRLKVDVNYHIRIRAISSVDTSRWSKANSFKTTFNFNSELPFPYYIYPPNKSINIAPNSVTFLWEDNTGGKATNYEFLISKNGEPFKPASLTSTSILLKNLTPNTTYTWYVRSYQKNLTSEQPTLNDYFTFTTSGFSKINSPDSNASILIFPNPVKNYLHVLLTNGNYITAMSIKGVDGKILYQISNVNSKQFQIDMSNFENGLYFIECQSDKSLISSKLFKY